jgi:hypothetical protein
MEPVVVVGAALFLCSLPLPRRVDVWRVDV